MTFLPAPLLPVILASLLLALLVVAWVLWPLRGPGPDRGLEARQLGSRVYRERLQELNADLSTGRVDADTYATLKLELDRALLADSEAGGAEAVPPRRVRGVAIAVAVLVPVLSLAAWLGHFLDPAVAPDLDSQARVAPALDKLLAGEMPDAGDRPHALPEFIRGLQRRVQQDPHNAEAWALLGMGFMQARELDVAMTALARAHELNPEDDQVAMTYVQAAVMRQQGGIDPLARRMLERILQRQPDHQGGLLMLGLASLRGGEAAQARDVLAHLQQLRATLPAAAGDAEADARIAALLAEADHALATAGTVPAAVATAGRYEIEVTVAPALARVIPADATVFIFARAPQGPPMPVAAIRRPAAQFPLLVVMTDADSLQPERLLSAEDKLVLQAKVSRSGDATSADWEAVAVPVQRGGTGPVRLRISEASR